MFVIFPRKELARELRVCEQRATVAFRKLAELKLIWEKRCGRGDANQIYLASVEPMNDPAYTSAPFLPQDSISCDYRPTDLEVLRKQDQQDRGLQNSGIDGPRTATPAVAEPQCLKASYKEKKDIEHSHIEVSRSVLQAKGDGQADDEEDLVGILDACELYCFAPETARVFENAIERLFYSESFRIGNAVLPRSRVRAKLQLLDGTSDGRAKATR